MIESRAYRIYVPTCNFQEDTPIQSKMKIVSGTAYERNSRSLLFGLSR
jgi:hypothetical protein